jgi:hypothetical protein
MKKLLVLAQIFILWAAALPAQTQAKPLSEIKIPIAEDASGKPVATLCCTPHEQFKKEDACSHVLVLPAGKNQAAGGSLSVAVRLVCKSLKESATVIASKGEWLVFPKGGPENQLFVVNCNSLQAFKMTDTWQPATPPGKIQISASNPPSDPKPVDPPADPAGDKGKPAPPDKANSNLKELEKTINEQKKIIQSLRQDLDKLGVADQELEKKLKDLEEAQKKSCIRIEDSFKGREEVMIAVGGSILRFLHVRPQSDKIPIGLSEAKAGEFLAEAQAESNTKIFPHIYLAVPEAVREVRPFFLQDRLIDGDMYARLTGEKNADRVSYEDVSRFIEDLNIRCEGRAKFALPTEEQFVAVAHEIYQPLVVGLKPCELLRREDKQFPFAELLGHSWQLTRTLCQPFSDPPKMTCADDRSYIRKGGAASSANPLECMPEFRSSAPFDVQQKETSFRLALAD